jgi:4-amino-4-deoxy-L-arabinose transferase-like glycosyltransferase
MTGNGGWIRPLNHRLGHHGLLCLVSAWLFFANLGSASLWDVDEGRNCGAALEMLETRQYIVPTFNATLRVDKPALLYWLQVLAYKSFGVNEFAARLPSALAALAAVLLAYELGRKLFSTGAGLLGGLILASTPMLCAAARFANPDALLHVFTVLTLFLFWKGFAASSRWWFVSVGISTGFAVLAKGPVGLVLPATVIGLFLIWARQLHRLLDRRLLLGIFAFLLVALPWYVWVAADTKANFLRGFLLTHNVNRFLSPMENHAGSPLYYLLVLLAGFAPWSVFLGLTLWYAWPGRGDSGVLLQERAGTANGQRFLLSWIVVYLAFFSLAATKLPNYMLPVCPPLALLTGWFLDRWRRGLLAPPHWLLLSGLAGLALIGIGTGVGLCAAGGVLSLPMMRGHTFQGLERWAALGLLPVGGAALAWWMLRRDQRTALLVSVTAAAILFLGSLAAWVCPFLNQYKAAGPLVTASGAFRRDRDIRIGAFQLEYLPSLNFYCQRTIMHQHSEAEVRDFLSMRDLPVFLFVPAAIWNDLSKAIRSPYRVVGCHADLYRNGEVLVIINK